MSQNLRTQDLTNLDILLAVHHSITFFIITNLIHKFLIHSHNLHKSFLSGCSRRSPVESDDTRGCICTICVVDLLMIDGLRSKYVAEFNFM
jgi:hypothetical protein